MASATVEPVSELVASRARTVRRAALCNLTAPAALRRVEKTGEALLREPDDRLQFERVEVAYPSAAQILQPQPRRVRCSVVGTKRDVVGPL